MSQPKQTPVAVPFVVARAIAAVISAIIFGVVLCVIGFLLCRGLIDTTLGVIPSYSVGFAFAVLLSFVPLFAGQGARVGLLDGYTQQRFYLPERRFFGDPPDPAAAVSSNNRPSNPWRVGAVASVLLGVPAAALAFTLAPRLWPDGLSLGSFVPRLAALGAVLAGTTSLLCTGALFRDEARLSASQRRFEGTVGAYRVLHHVLPQGLSNLVINAWVAVPLFPHPVSTPGATVPIALVIGDAFVSAVVISIAVWVGVLPHVDLDKRSGVIAAQPTAAPSRGRQLGLLFAVSVALAVCVYGVSALTGIQGLSFWPFLLWRAFAFGGYAAWVAQRSATWALAARP